MLISEAFAQAAAPAQTDANLASLLPMLGILILFYFLLIRPQWKRAREQKQMVEALQRGDEVITNGGILGLIINVSENYIIIEIAPAVEVTVLKSSVQTLLPKGTLKTIDPKSNKLQKTKPTKTADSAKTDDVGETSENSASETQKTIDNK